MYLEKLPESNMHTKVRFGSFYSESVGGSFLMDVFERTQLRQVHVMRLSDAPYSVTGILHLRVDFSVGKVSQIFQRNLGL